MHLRKSLDATSRVEKYKTFRKLFHCKMAEGSLINTYIKKIRSINLCYLT